MRFRVIGFLLWLLPLAYAAQATSPWTVAVPRIETPASLRALIEPDRPTGFVAVTGFVQHDPREGVPVSQATTAYVAYDNHNIYAVFHCEDTQPGEIRAHISRRDDILNDDYVGVALDTDFDHRRAIVFMVNARGQQQDGLLQQSTIDAKKQNVRYDLEAADFSFDTVWHSTARLEENGYRVAISIPFKSLRFPHLPVQQWGVLLFRYIPRDGELSYWPAVSRHINGLVTQEGSLNGLSHVEAAHNLQFIPYGLFRAEHSLDPQTGLFTDERFAPRIGLDSKYTFLTDMNLDVTLNPDFSQVESDTPQVTTNQRFEVFFPEKRPFFQERSDIFTTPTDLFFSRRILDPEYGVRLTGKQGGTTIGMLWSDDRGPGELIQPGNFGYHERAYLSTVRLQQDIFSDSTFGILFTSRRFLDRDNDVIGADTSLRLSNSLRVSGQAIESFTRGPSLYAAPTTISGGPLIQQFPASNSFIGVPAYSAGLHYFAHSWEADASYDDISTLFQADLGYLPRADIRDVHADLRRNVWGTRRFALFQPILLLRRNWDHTGVVQDDTVAPGFFTILPHDFRLEGYVAHYLERYLGNSFSKNQERLNFGLPFTKWLSFGGGYVQGDNVNYYPAAGLAPFLGNYQGAAAKLDLNPTSRLQVTNLYLAARLQTRDHRNVFNNNIWRDEWLYQFSRELSLRFILDYQNNLPNGQLTTIPYTKSLGFDGLLTYMVAPGTAIYVGYDSLNENYLQPLQFDPFGNLLRGPNFITSGRQFFAKLSYLYRF